MFLDTLPDLSFENVKTSTPLNKSQAQVEEAHASSNEPKPSTSRQKTDEGKTTGTKQASDTPLSMRYLS